MNFEFSSAGRIVFGSGSIAQLPAIAASLGRRPLVVTGKRRARVAAGDFATAYFEVHREPTIATVTEGVEVFSAPHCDLVVAIGGGSVIDAGKAIAAAAANPRSLLDYLEVIGKGLPLDSPPYPFIAVPTTAGTGSEVTRNAVLGSPEHGVKVSLRSPLMLARAAIVDPDLTLDLPPALTASTGLDALAQLIEPYVCLRANPMTDAFCLDGIERIARSLERAFADGHDRAAREDMSYASLLGGLALANAGLGVVHGFAAPIGGMFDAPHGAVCAAILPHGMRANIEAATGQARSALPRYQRVAAILTGNPHASAEQGVEWVQNLVQTLGIPTLQNYGIKREHARELAQKAARSSSMKANPIALGPEELTAVLEQAL